MSTDESVFIIGGRRESQVATSQQYTDAVYQYKNEVWKLAAQQLQYQRVGHASILIDKILYIFGGSVRSSDGSQV